MPFDPVAGLDPTRAVRWADRSTPPVSGNGFHRAELALDEARRVDGTNQVHQALIPQGDGAIERRAQDIR